MATAGSSDSDGTGDRERGWRDETREKLCFCAVVSFFRRRGSRPTFFENTRTGLHTHTHTHTLHTHQTKLSQFVKKTQGKKNRAGVSQGKSFFFNVHFFSSSLSSRVPHTPGASRRTTHRCARCVWGEGSGWGRSVESQSSGGVGGKNENTKVADGKKHFCRQRRDGVGDGTARHKKNTEPKRQVKSQRRGGLCLGSLSS